MLNGGGGLNADGLALDLQFAADKTLTARKGPTPTFTRGSTGTFVGSNGLIQSAAINTPRFDHTSAGVCRGLLIEESRTNVMLQSENFGTTWTSNQLNVTGSPAYLNVATSPDGSTTADKIIANSTTSTHQFRQSVTLVAGTTYSLSCYFKAAEQQFASFQVFGTANGSVDWSSLFNISSTPSVGYFNGFTSASIVAVGSGWNRCTVVFTATASGSLGVRIGGSKGVTLGDNTYLGDDTSGILVWGAQLEAGPFATSYIPTTTGSVVRSADVCSITGGNFSGMWNASEGTVFASGDPRGGTGVATFVMANSGSNANQIAFDRITTQVKFGVANSGTYTATISQNSTNGSFVKTSGAYATNNARSAVNGVLGTPDTSVIVPTNLNRLNIGSAGASNTEFANGCIAEIKYFRKPLSNAKLQSLTA